MNRKKAERLAPIIYEYFSTLRESRELEKKAMVLRRKIAKALGVNNAQLNLYLSEIFKSINGRK